MSEYNKVIQIEPQHDQFDDVRMEYAQMLKQQLAKGNNGLVRTKYITFSIEAKSVKEAKPRLERIETDILNNFKVLGVKAYPLNGVERLQIMYEMFHQEEERKFEFSYDRILQSGMTTKDFIAPTSFLFKSGKDFQMGDTIGAVSYLNILAPELTDKVLAEFLDMDKNLVVSIHVQSVDQLKAIKLIKGKITDLDRMKIEEQKRRCVPVMIWKLFRVTLQLMEAKPRRFWMICRAAMSVCSLLRCCSSMLRKPNRIWTAQCFRRLVSLRSSTAL